MAEHSFLNEGRQKPHVEIDRSTIRALSADSRLKILKLLAGRRATGADISRALGLSPSTVNEHMKKLEASNLVLRKETGNKWIYYEVSEKGRALVAPAAQPLQFVVVLAIGVLLFLGGAFFSLAQKFQPQAVPQPMAEAARAAVVESAIAESAQIAIVQPSLLPLLAMFVGVVIIIVMLTSFHKGFRKNGI